MMPVSITIISHDGKIERIHGSMSSSGGAATPVKQEFLEFIGHVMPDFDYTSYEEDSLFLYRTEQERIFLFQWFDDYEDEDERVKDRWGYGIFDLIFSKITGETGSVFLARELIKKMEEHGISTVDGASPGYDREEKKNEVKIKTSRGWYYHDMI